MRKSLLVICLLATVTAVCAFLATRKKEKYDILSDLLGGIDPAEIPYYLLGISTNPNEVDTIEQEEASANASSNVNIDQQAINNINTAQASSYETGRTLFLTPTQIYGSTIPRASDLITVDDRNIICNAINASFTQTQLEDLKTNERPVFEAITALNCPANTTTVASTSQNSSVCNLITNHIARGDQHMNTASLLLKCELPVANIIDANGNCLDHQGNPSNQLQFKPCRNALSPTDCNAIMAPARADLSTLTQQRDAVKSQMDNAYSTYQNWETNVNNCESPPEGCINPYDGRNDCCDWYGYGSSLQNKNTTWNQYQSLKTQYDALADRVNQAQAYINSIDCNTTTDQQSFLYAPYDYAMQTKTNTSMCMALNPLPNGGNEIRFTPCDGTVQQMFRVNTDVKSISTKDKTQAMQNLSLAGAVKVQRSNGTCLTFVENNPPLRWLPCDSQVNLNQIFKRGVNGNLQTFTNPARCVQPVFQTSGVQSWLNNKLILGDNCSDHSFHVDTDGSKGYKGSFGYYNIPGNWNTALSADTTWPDHARLIQTNTYGASFVPGDFIAAPDYVKAAPFAIGNDAQTFRMKPIGLTPAKWIDNWIQGKGLPADSGLSINDLFYAINNTEDRSQYYYTKANLTELWVHAPYNEERFLGYVSGKKVGYLYRDGRWDVFKRFVTNQGLPLEHTCNWFTRDGGVLYSLKQQAAGTNDDSIMNELIRGLILEGTRISIMIKDRSEVYGGPGGSLAKDESPNGFVGAYLWRGGSNVSCGIAGCYRATPGPINGIEFIKKTNGPTYTNPRTNSPCNNVNGDYIGCPPTQTTPGRGSIGTSRFSDNVRTYVYGPGGQKCYYVYNSRGDIMPEYTRCVNEYSSTDEVWNLTNRANTIQGEYNMYTSSVLGGLMSFPDPSKNYINKIGFGANKEGNYAERATSFSWTCPDSSQYIDTIYTRSGHVLDAIQVECTARKVTIGYVDDNHVGLLKTPDGDWIDIRAMFTLIGNCPKMQAGGEGFAFREGYSCGWSAPWDCASDLYNNIKNFGQTAYGWIKDTAGNIYGSVKAFTLDAWDKVKDWASGLGSNFYNWAKDAGATFVQTMITIGNGIADGAKAGFKFVANNIVGPIVSVIKDIGEGLKQFINILCDFFEIAKDGFMSFFRKISSSLGSTWTIIKTILGFMINYVLGGKQCMFLKFSKDDTSGLGDMWKNCPTGPALVCPSGPSGTNNSQKLPSEYFNLDYSSYFSKEAYIGPSAGGISGLQTKVLEYGGCGGTGSDGQAATCGRYKAIKLLVYTLANPIYKPDKYENTPISSLPVLNSIKYKKKVPQEPLFRGIRQPVKDICQKFINTTLGSIPYLGPVIQIIVKILMLPPLTWWVDWKIDNEIFVPMFDWKRDEILNLLTPLLDSSVGWTCDVMNDIKQAAICKMKQSFASKTCETSDSMSSQLNATANLSS